MTPARLHTSLKPSGAPWLGDVPVHWEVKPLWSMYRPKKITGHPAETLLSVYRDYGVIEKSSRDDNKNRASEDLSGYQLVVKGDLVTNKMKTWQGSIAVSGLQGIVSPAYYVYSKLHAGNDSFFHHLFRSLPYVTGYQSISKGIRVGQWDLEADKFRLFPVLIPPRLEQDAIVAYLDRATSRIDTLVAKKTRFIELLREKRQALITHAVTNGIEPNVPMKDSGVEWLGAVPSHWIVGRLRDFTTSISTGPFGTALGAADYVSGGIPVINPSHIDEGGCSPDETVSVNEATAMRLLPWQLRTGDIVTARRGELGRSAVIREAENGWICGTGSLRLRPNTSKASSAYIHAVLQSVSGRSWLEYQSVGSTMPNLSEALVGNLPIAVPPSIPEQDSLLTELAHRNQKIDTLIAKTERSIELLREHRTALITTAVTGKIDLRPAA